MEEQGRSQGGVREAGEAVKWEKDFGKGRGQELGGTWKWGWGCLWQQWDVVTRKGQTNKTGGDSGGFILPQAGQPPVLECNCDILSPILLLWGICCCRLWL